MNIRTRTDDLVKALADDIINGRLFPGTRLDEHSLAERFEVSRTPVREALRQLVATGLVEKRAHKGVVVASITAPQLSDMFDVMADLEALCATYAAKRMTATERKRLECLHLTSRELVQVGSADDYASLNTEFHTAIYHGAHNDYLEELAGMTRKRLSPFRRAQFRMMGRMAGSFQEHDAIVQAILSGNGEAAGKAMRDHVLTVSAASVEYVAAKGER